jgi:hypothetical protein
MKGGIFENRKDLKNNSDFIFYVEKPKDHQRYGQTP